MELKAFVKRCKEEGYFKEIFNSGNYESYSSCGGTSESNVSISLSHDFDRKLCGADFEAEIERTWNLRKEKNPFLFNGSKFRLHDVYYGEKTPVITLSLGQTCYKDYVCTNMNFDHWKFLTEYGRRVYANEQACFSDALGVGSIVETSDDKLVFIRRSNQVYEDPYHLDTPGGHAEPSEVKPQNHNSKEHFIDINEMDEKAVVHELFHSIVREVRDEINIQEESLNWPLLMGIHQNHRTGKKPGVCFRIKCLLSGEEVKQLYNEGGPESYESSEMLLVDRAEFHKGMSSHQVSSLFKDLTPGCKACLYFYFNQQANKSV